ncbi:MAG: hypothetical protein K2P21_11725 [Lachnospiraceae bacterium]|nr:hypothetical protein [Lachnospiraceae bacterium]
MLILTIIVAFYSRTQNIYAAENGSVSENNVATNTMKFSDAKNRNDYFSDKYLNVKELINNDNIISVNGNILSFAEETLIHTNNKSLIQKEEIIRKDTLSLVMNSEESAKRLANSLQDGSVYEEGWDSSITVKLYSTIYYGRRKGIQNATFTYIKSMNGGYTISGSNGTTISSHYVRYSQTGMSEKNRFPCNPNKRNREICGKQEDMVNYPSLYVGCCTYWYWRRYWMYILYDA